MTKARRLAVSAPMFNASINFGSERNQKKLNKMLEGIGCPIPRSPIPSSKHFLFFTELIVVELTIVEAIFPHARIYNNISIFEEHSSNIRTFEHSPRFCRTL